MEEFLEHLQKIKNDRKKRGEDVSHMAMLHIVRSIGGKYIKKGLITSRELDLVQYQGCGSNPYLGEKYKFWEDDEGDKSIHEMTIIDFLNALYFNRDIEYTIIDLDGTEFKPRPYIHMLGDKEENIYSLSDTIRVHSKLKENK